MRSDLLGLVLSGSCLVHCLMLPVAVLLAPALAVWLGETETMLHWCLFAIALLVSGWALYGGYRHHGAWLVIAAGAFGLSVMAVAAAHVLGTPLEAPLTVTGATIVGLAHFMNLRLSLAAQR